ncbi:MAG TPA: DUF4240 domain-containing protein [Gemmataceae bacterium]|nr:DUF4240 domain-containing protein [Gemmataceae bacterium]
MDQKSFWEVIAAACRSDPSAVDKWDETLTKELACLQPDDILEFDRIFDELADRAYRRDLWGVASMVNGGASDDGFYYFRCWLVGMGQRVYEAALTDPDSLADVVIPPEQDAEAEIYAAAQRAWEKVTGREGEYPLCLPARNDGGQLKGEKCNWNNKAEVRKRFPRLAAIYLDEE